MNPNTKFKWSVRIVIGIAVALLLAGVLITTVGAQEAGEGSATIEYNYSSGAVEYELNDSLFESYQFDAISEPTQYTPFSVGSSDAPTQIQWADNGNSLYFSDGDGTIYQVTVSEPYNPSSSEFQYSQAVPASDGSTRIKDFQVSDDGQELIYMMADFTSGSSDTLRQVSLGTAYDVTSMGSTDDHTLAAGLNNYYSFEITNDGQTIYKNDDSILWDNQLGSAWDISTAGSWGFVDTYHTEFSTVDDIEFGGSNDELLTIYPEGTNEILVLEGLHGPREPTVVSRTEVESIESFTWSETGQELFVSRADTTTTTAIDGYTINDYEGSLRDNNDEIIESIGTVSETGQIPYSADMLETGIYLQWNAVTDSSYSGSSNAISIYGSGEMSIRDEQTNELITDTVNVTAYGEQSGIYSLDTSDGTIDITGLPNQAYTFSVTSDGYTQRNKYVEQLGNVDNLYLLSNQTDQVTSQFILEDTTNTFDSESRLIIERSVEGNGNDWETVYSDSFGVEGVTATLQEDVRYRISLENDEIRRTIGPYRATISEVVTISPESGEIEISSEGSWSAGASYSNDNINVRFHDPTNAVDSVSITIHERGNESNTLAVNDEYVDPTDLRAEYAVPDEYNESNWIVEITAEHAGESTTIGFQVGPTLDTVPSDLDPLWRNVISVIIILTFGLGISVINRAVGAIVLACVGGLLWWIGWLAGATAGVLITAYLFIAIAYGIYTKTL